jgi:hypothetical protein
MPIAKLQSKDEESHIFKRCLNILTKSYLTLGKSILAEKPLKDITKINPKNEVAKELLRQCA